MLPFDALINLIPAQISQIAVLQYIQQIKSKHLMALKEYANANDDRMSDWLDVSVRTFRNYKTKDIELKIKTKESAVLLISLFKHGRAVFGSQEDFNTWLHTENFHLDNEPPINYLNTITGIRFIDDRLTAMEYGDNV